MSEPRPELLEKPREQSARSQASPRGDSAGDSRWTGLADLGLVALFLILTFLLGAFPLKDVDIYWHLRTGDLIRQTGQVPRTDIFTFTAAPETPWIDLHWLFQVAISWGHQHGGIVGLNLAKCAITCAAVLLLVTARRRDWPIWAILLAWLPALLVLSGRMYIRPETLTLLYLSMFLAIISRWDRFPRLAWLLPLIQVAWVNSHGLFVLGPIVVVFGLCDALVRSGAAGLGQKGWWRTILAASAGTGLACFLNPYFHAGALYPLALAGTMRNPVFSSNIAELMPIPLLIESTGWRNLPLELHLATIALGALSFLVPLGWVALAWLSSRTTVPEKSASGPKKGATAARAGTAQPAKSKRRSKGKKSAQSDAGQPLALERTTSGWRLSPFRILLYLSFSLLSMQATRNSHQFAAVVGTVTAWNFGEWAAAVRRRRLEQGTALSAVPPAVPRLITLAAVVGVLIWVGSGQFYQATGEGRVIGLDEEPLWFPHEAIRFAGKPGMPSRFLSFHNGHASLYEYYHGPENKVFTDPRLEVAGVEVFERYKALEQRILEREPGWESELDKIGRPAILTDHEFNTALGAALLSSTHWRCVWFDAIAAVFVHESFLAAGDVEPVDFAARHYRRDDGRADSRSTRELIALGKAYRSYVQGLSQARPDLARPLAWLGLDCAGLILNREPDSFDGWKIRGQIETSRELAGPPLERLRAPFDAVADLSPVRATYALERALERAPNDFVSLMELKHSFDLRFMTEAALPLSERLVALYPKNKRQAAIQDVTRRQLPIDARRLGAPPPSSWRNLSDLDQIVTRLLAAGRAETAAALLEKAYPLPRASWDVIDRIATLRLHLGQPAQARAAWRAATDVPRPSVRDARVAATYLAEGNFADAIRFFEQALATTPDLFEAAYGLALANQDAGDATAAFEHARAAIVLAPDTVSRTAARTIAAGAKRFARASATAMLDNRRSAPE